MLIAYILSACILLQLDGLYAETTKSTETTLRLEECFKLALKHSERIGLAEEDIKAAEARYQYAISTLFPNVSLNISERLRNSTNTNNNNNGSNTIGGFVGSRNDRFESGIRLTQPIFAGFKDIILAKAAKEEIQSFSYQKQREVEILYRDVAQAFYQVILYENDIKEIRATINTLEKRVNELNEWEKLGKSKVSEVLAAKAAITDARVTEERINGLIAASREALDFLLGSSGYKLEKDSVTKYQIMPAIDTLLTSSNNRADIRSAETRTAVAEKVVDATRREYWPVITMESNGYVKQSPDSNRDWDLIFNLSMPIFDSGRIKNRITEHESLLRSEKLRLSEQQRKTKQEVRSAYVLMQAKIQELKETREFVTASRDSYEAQTTDYEKGLVNNLDVLRALQDFHESRRRLIAAEIEVLLANVQLKVASGDLQL